MLEVHEFKKVPRNCSTCLYGGGIGCGNANVGKDYLLKPDGVLIFKWSEYDIAAEKVWKAIGEKPLFGHHSGKKMGAFWGCYMKLED